jgi:hypothetical protein
MAKANAKKKPEDETLEQIAPDDAASETLEQDDSGAEETDAETEDEATPVAATSTVQPSLPADLHTRLTKAARVLTTHGQERHFAVHQLEHLTGKLKMMLPAGIAAIDDAALKADLELLHGLL